MGPGAVLVSSRAQRKPSMTPAIGWRPYSVRQGCETILVVEDEPEVRRLASGMLRRLGYTVLEASDGTEGQRLLAQHDGNISAAARAAGIELARAKD